MLIDLVYRLLYNNCYSVLLNGQAQGFFKSTRGVKQGDPLSPALFVIATEALSRGLNELFHNPRFIPYGTPKWSPELNHLAYADDTILFFYADKKTLQLITSTAII